MSFQEEQTDAVVILLVRSGPHVCNHSRVIFESATKKLGKESQRKEYQLQNTIRASSRRGKGARLLPGHTGQGKTNGGPWHSSLSVSATEDTESWGKAVANKCVEIFVPVKWSL